jgi:hypothetical protein
MKAQEADSLGLYSTRLRVYRINCDGQKMTALSEYTPKRARTLFESSSAAAAVAIPAHLLEQAAIPQRLRTLSPLGNQSDTRHPDEVPPVMR